MPTYTVLRSTTQGSGYAQIASGLTAATHTDTGRTNGTPYYYIVRAVEGGLTSPNSNEASATPFAQTSGVVTKSHGLIHAQENADMTFASHDTKVYFISGAGLNGRKFNAPTSEAAGHLVNGTAVVRKVSKLIPHLNQSRNFFEHTLWSTFPPYSGNNSLRDSVACGYNTLIQVGQPWWYAGAFMIDGSMYEEMGTQSGFDVNFTGLHDAVNMPHPGLTPFSCFIDPTSASAMKMHITLRRHPTDNAPQGSTAYEEVQGLAEALNIRKDHYYEWAMEFSLGYWNSHNGYARWWLWEDGVPRNGGAPVVNYQGRLGYNLSNFSHEMRLFGFYLWRGAGQFSPVSANNISGIPSGTKGCRMWVRKNCAIKGGTANGVTVSRDSLLGYLRLVE